MSRKKYSSTQKKRHPNVSGRLRNHIQNRSLAEMYASLFEHNPDSIISLNLEGVILHINPSAERILGYTSNELERKTITSILEAHISDQVLQYIKNAAADNQKEYIVSIYHKDGYLLDVVTKLVPIFVKNRLTGVYAIMKPLEKSERIEKVLQESEKRLRTLMNSMPAFVIFKDHEGRWLEANDYALSCFNFHNVPYHGKKDNELIQYNEAYRESFLHCEEVDELTWQKGQILHGEEFIIHRNDFDLVLSISKVPLFHPDGSRKGLIVMGRDVTELKETEKLLRKSEKLAVVGQLTAGIAHEIRNPLTSLKGFLTLLHPEINEENKWYVDVMLSEISQMESITSQFMAMSKPQVLSIHTCNVQTLIEEVVTFILPTAVMHSVHIIMDHFDYISDIQCDSNQLKQVLINILKNAIEAMPAGGNIFIQTASLENDFVSIRIMDEGCGIPEERMARLGEPFYSLKEKGTGLGLMMCYKIIQEHHGKLFISSELNIGTTVDIQLPIATAQPVTNS
ncbi:MULTISPECIES: BA3702 family sensor histidine kinase [Bacillus]|uniref:BA3702 family sensor histidine kinase n=1 Tax=Bacillus TaxID=1386 RepID=UPI000991B644|nr:MULTISPECIES: BA3702 family sensor histidine kinase [Bacillus]MBG9723606.1 histidine kinase [Bacillus mycoides]MBK5506456.1 PAS domain S-box protein [Bacillus sp. TH12]MCP9228027.1 PAS domain S-box protein [Bacillus mycoides]OOR00151.1 PAS domain-containing sensor histidine kinase [Bacillus mycoides]OOR17358.1 PAS domain-containing sensor histidine kinase [Bacillus mycoides]